MNGSVGALNDGNLIDSVEVDEAKSKYFAEK
jgi:ribonucleoside-triphosphate reductase